MDKPSDWTSASRSPFGLLNDAWARASVHHRSPPAAPPPPRRTLRRWSALIATLEVWFMPRH